MHLVRLKKVSCNLKERIEVPVINERQRQTYFSLYFLLILLFSIKSPKEANLITREKLYSRVLSLMQIIF